MRLKDQVAIITGGAAGIGKATASRFVEEGATTIICDVNEETGKQTAWDLGAAFYKVNVVDRDKVQQWIDNVIKEYERIVEYSYHPKHERFVIRFLDGTSYVLNIVDLPKKLQTRKPDWKNTHLSSEKSCIIVAVGDGFREIPAHLIHSRGNAV